MTDRVDLDALEFDDRPAPKRRAKAVPGEFAPNPELIPRCKTCKFWHVQGDNPPQARQYWPDMSDNAVGKTYGSCKLLQRSHRFEDGEPFTGEGVVGLWITAQAFQPAGMRLGSVTHYTLETFGCTEHKPKRRRKK